MKGMLLVAGKEIREGMRNRWVVAATLLLGTGGRDRRQVDADLAAVGGHLDTGVDPQRLLVTGSVLASGLPTLLDVLADCLTGAAYRKDDVLGERARLVEHLMISAAQPASSWSPSSCWRSSCSALALSTGRRRPPTSHGCSRPPRRRGADGPAFRPSGPGRIA